MQQKFNCIAIAQLLTVQLVPILTTLACSDKALHKSPKHHFPPMEQYLLLVQRHTSHHAPLPTN